MIVQKIGKYMSKQWHVQAHLAIELVPHSSGRDLVNHPPMGFRLRILGQKTSRFPFSIKLGGPCHYYHYYHSYHRHHHHHHHHHPLAAANIIMIVYHLHLPMRNKFPRGMAPPTFFTRFCCSFPEYHNTAFAEWVGMAGFLENARHHRTTPKTSRALWCRINVGIQTRSYHNQI